MWRGSLDELLHVHVAVVERLRPLGACMDTFRAVPPRVIRSHPAPAAAGNGFEDHRITDALRQPRAASLEVMPPCRERSALPLSSWSLSRLTFLPCAATSGGGPMNLMFEARHISAKLAFSRASHSPDGSRRRPRSPPRRLPPAYSDSSPPAWAGPCRSLRRQSARGGCCGLPHCIPRPCGSPSLCTPRSPAAQSHRDLQSLPYETCPAFA